MFSSEEHSSNLLQKVSCFGIEVIWCRENFSESFFFNFFTFIYFWKAGWDKVRVGERQREREPQDRKQAPGSEWSAQSPMRGSNPQTMRSRPEPKLDAQPTEPPRHPWKFLNIVSFCLPFSLSLSLSFFTLSVFLFFFSCKKVSMWESTWLGNNILLVGTERDQAW